MRIVAALAVGIVMGAALWLLLRQEGVVPPADQQSAAAAAPSAPSTGTDALAGRAFVSNMRPGLLVTVTRDGAAEVGARVEVAGSSRSPITSATDWHRAGVERTDSEGRVAFPLLAGHYIVVATARDGAQALKMFDVSWSHASTAVELVLEKPIHFSGRVLEAGHGKPIAGAAIRADPGERSRRGFPDVPRPTLTVAETATDSLGRFGLALPTRLWRLEARAPGYLSNSRLVQVPLEEPAPELVFELQRGVQVSGLVVDGAGKPVAEAAILIAPAESVSLTSDAQGRFSFTAPPEPISLHALALDGRQGLLRLRLAEGQERAEARISVGEGIDLGGVVMGEGGPVAGARVHVIAEPEPLEVASLETGLDGRFVARSLPQGRYSIRAQQGSGRRATVVGLELPGAGPVELRLPPEGQLMGLVVDGQGAPVDGASVSVEWRNGLNELKRTARTGPDGRFEFGDLLPSELSVVASLGDLIEEESTYVAPGATVALQMTLAPQGRLVAKVVGQASKVFLVSEGRKSTFDSFIDVDPKTGRVERALPAGRYTLMLPIPKDGSPWNGKNMRLVMAAKAEVRSGETTWVELIAPDDADASDDDEDRRHAISGGIGSGLSFENSPGGVRVDFMTSDSAAARAGVRTGDLVVSIDGRNPRDALDAFDSIRSPSKGQLEFIVRRDGKDIPLVIR